MLPAAVSPLLAMVPDAIEGPFTTSETPAFSERALAGAEAAATSPEGSTPEEGLGDEVAENLPCQVNSSRARPKEAPLEEAGASCECSSPHSLEPGPRS